MKNLFYPLLIVIFLLSFNLNNSWAGGMLFGTGDLWKIMTKDMKVSYVSGVIEGMMTGFILASTRIDDKLIVKELMRLQAELTPEKSEDIIEIVDGIDKFYSDYANKKVTINNAYILVLKRMNGYPEDKLQKEIEAARIGGVELNKLTIKEK